MLFAITLHLFGGVLVAAPDCAETLNGRLVDPEGAPIGFARVEVRAREASSVAGVDEQGRFRFGALCPGPVKLSAQVPGGPIVERALTIPTATVTLRLGEAEVEEVVAETEPTGGVIRIEDSAIIERQETQATETIDRDELRKRRGADLARTVEQTNGARVVGNGFIAKPVLRGQTGARVSLVNDGVRHASQTWGLDHAPEVDPFASDEVEVVQGAAGVLYGAGAIGGVVVLKPREPPDEPGLLGDVDLIAATNDARWAGNLSLVGRAPGRLRNLTFRAQASYTRAANAQAPRYPIDNTGAEVLGGSAGVGYEAGRDRFSADYDLYNADLGIFRGLQNENLERFRRAIESDVPPLVELFGNSYDIDRPRQEVTHHTAKVEWVHLLSATSTLTTTYAFQYDRRREFDIVRASLMDRPQVAFDLFAHELSTKLEAQVDAVEVRGGAELRYVDNDYFGTTRLIADQITIGGSVFGLLRWILPALELEVGGRVDVESMDTDQAARVNASRNPRIERSFLFAAPSLTAGLVWPLFKGWTVRGQVAAASRVPAVNELTIDGGSPATAVYENGNDELNIETIYEVSAGLEGQTGPVGAKVTGHASYSPSYINFTPGIDPNGDPDIEFVAAGILPSFVYEQVAATLFGVDAELWLRPFPFIEWRGRLSMVRGRNLDDGGGLFLVPPDRFENRIRFFFDGLGLGDGDAPTLDVSHIFTRQQDEFDIQRDFSPAPDAYHLVNAFLQVPLDVDGQPVIISVEGYNLFDTTYRDYLSRLRYYTDEMGRNITFRFTVPLDVPLENRS